MARCKVPWVLPVQLEKKIKDVKLYCDCFPITSEEAVRKHILICKYIFVDILLNILLNEQNVSFLIDCAY